MKEYFLILFWSFSLKRAEMYQLIAFRVQNIRPQQNQNGPQERPGASPHPQQRCTSGSRVYEAAAQVFGWFCSGWKRHENSGL